MKKWTILVLAVMITLSVRVQPVSAQTIITPVEGDEVCGPVLGIDPINFDLHARNAWSYCTDTMYGEPRLTGEAVVTINWNFKFTTHPYGPMWGTVRLINENGYWEGSWVGEITKLEGYSYINVVSRGYGDYEGLQARLNYFKDSPMSSTYQVSGFIMDPGGD